MSTESKDIATGPNYSHETEYRKAFFLKRTVEPLSVAISLSELIEKINTNIEIFYRDSAIQAAVVTDINKLLDTYKAEVSDIVDDLKNEDNILHSEIKANRDAIIELDNKLQETKEKLENYIAETEEIIDAVTGGMSIENIKKSSLLVLRTELDELKAIVDKNDLITKEHAALLKDLDKPIKSMFDDVATELLNIKNNIDNIVIDVSDIKTAIEGINTSIVDIDKRLSELENDPSVIITSSTAKYDPTYKIGTMYLLTDTNTVAIQTKDLGDGYEDKSYSELIDSSDLQILNIKGLDSNNVLKCGSF